MVAVEGPMSQQRPVPMIEALADGVTGNTGNISLSMPDGERCKGRWSSAAGAGMTITSVNLITKYGPIYGSAFSSSSGHGQNPGQAILVCDRGTIIQVEFITGAGTAHGFGFATDSNGNVYRLVF